MPVGTASAGPSILYRAGVLTFCVFATGRSSRGCLCSAGWVARDADGYPVTRTPAGVLRAARSARDLAAVDERVCGCRACPRLVAWREEVAEVKRGRLPRRGLLGPAGHGPGAGRRAHRRRRAGPGRARRQPHRPDLHRRPLRRLGLRRPLAGRAGQPAHVDQPGRRPRGARRAHRLRRPLRPAGQRAHPDRARHVLAVACPRAAAAAPAAGGGGARRLRLDGAAAGAGRRGVRAAASPAEVRPRRGGRAGWPRRAAHAAGQLPREPAETRSPAG